MKNKIVDSPIVSVVIPAYNSSKTIERALRSVIGQTYPNLDIIVVDDCSADFEELKRIVEDVICDERLRIIRHEFNRKGSAARNTAIANAKGSYVALLDSDDEWLPDHIERNLGVVALHNDLEEFLIYSRMDVRGRTRNYILPVAGKANGQSVSKYLFMKGGFISTCGMFMPLSVARSFPFNEELIRHQDYDFVLRLESNHVPFLYSDHIGAIIHWENNSPATKGGTIEYSLSWVLKNKSYFDKAGFSGFILKSVVWPLLRQGQYKKGFSLFYKYCNPFSISLYNWYVTLTILKGRIV